ncbi:hypothetical protein MtrunA17_Chr8g0349901 [Medicago truncatula]|nr:hypothetical protein MtrunA17_Chr8g0349901 [Medicago truncatula]
MVKNIIAEVKFSSSLMSGASGSSSLTSKFDFRSRFLRILAGRCTDSFMAHPLVGLL